MCQGKDLFPNIHMLSKTKHVFREQWTEVQWQWHIAYHVTGCYWGSGLPCYSVAQSLCTSCQNTEKSHRKCLKYCCTEANINNSIALKQQKQWKDNCRGVRCWLEDGGGWVGWVGLCLLYYPKDQNSTDEWSHRTWQSCGEIPTQRRTWRC